MPYVLFPTFITIMLCLIYVTPALPAPPALLALSAPSVHSVCYSGLTLLFIVFISGLLVLPCLTLVLGLTLILPADSGPLPGFYYK